MSDSFRDKEGGVARGGMYALVLKVGEPSRKVCVGSLGEVIFKAGFYVYTGSALKNLDKRIQRHLRRGGKRRHWHIDYLRETADVVAVLTWNVKQRLECCLNDAISQMARGCVAGFGSSDCSCRSHLHHFPTNPVRILATLMPGREKVTGPQIYTSPSSDKARNPEGPATA